MANIDVGKLLEGTTPGPWRICSKMCEIWAGDDLVAEVHQSWEDAALLHAAPSLARDNIAMREALAKIMDLDHHNMGPESRATGIARAALAPTPSDEVVK